ALIDRFHFNINAKAKVQELSVGEQQRVEILKAIYRGANILILDEPTAVLTPQEVEELFVIMRNLKKDNKSIIIITHKLKETLAIADRIPFCAMGKWSIRPASGNVATSDLAKMMVGRDVELNAPGKYEHGRGVFPDSDSQLSERGVQV
ncbi:MAG: ATP-binding cassette domain-containing protein, partial [Merdibacter sp.]